MSTEQFNNIRKCIYWGVLSVINFVFAQPNPDESKTDNSVSFVLGVLCLFVLMYYTFKRPGSVEK